MTQRAQRCGESNQVGMGSFAHLEGSFTGLGRPKALLGSQCVLGHPDESSKARHNHKTIPGILPLMLEDPFSMASTESFPNYLVVWNWSKPKWRRRTRWEPQGQKSNPIAGGDFTHKEFEVAGPKQWWPNAWGKLKYQSEEEREGFCSLTLHSHFAPIPQMKSRVSLRICKAQSRNNCLVFWGVGLWKVKGMRAARNSRIQNILWIFKDAF